MSKKVQSTLENLRLALHGVTSPFSCEGTFVPDKPVTIVFKDRTKFEIVRANNSFDQESELRPLFEHCRPAPFGDGNALAMTGECATRFNSKPRTEGLPSRTSTPNRPAF